MAKDEQWMPYDLPYETTFSSSALETLWSPGFSRKSLYDSVVTELVVDILQSGQNRTCADCPPIAYCHPHLNHQAHIPPE
jgi:hypothetical protein